MFRIYHSEFHGKRMKVPMKRQKNSMSQQLNSQKTIGNESTKPFALFILRNDVLTCPPTFTLSPYQCPSKPVNTKSYSDIIKQTIQREKICWCWKSFCSAFRGNSLISNPFFSISPRLLPAKSQKHRCRYGINLSFQCALSVAD